MSQNLRFLTLIVGMAVTGFAIYRILSSKMNSKDIESNQHLAAKTVEMVFLGFVFGALPSLWHSITHPRQFWVAWVLFFLGATLLVVGFRG